MTTLITTAGILATLGGVIYSIMYAQPVPEPSRPDDIVGALNSIASALDTPPSPVSTLFGKGFWWNIYPWQSLIGGGLAVIAALIGANALISQTRRIEAATLEAANQQARAAIRAAELQFNAVKEQISAQSTQDERRLAHDRALVSEALERRSKALKLAISYEARRELSAWIEMSNTIPELRKNPGRTLDFIESASLDPLPALYSGWEDIGLLSLDIIEHIFTFREFHGQIILAFKRLETEARRFSNNDPNELEFMIDLTLKLLTRMRDLSIDLIDALAE
ncbi:hypothetical protein [Arenibaculum pallidiluteum]|uniref:hypothetical protein n=1 Tax=Arenibaculum pallidiluteum TaxID=2812559 RepID=UPI001A956CCC|nr:hypothetical protein [Arenibaculum pallidiluteum]